MRNLVSRFECNFMKKEYQTYVIVIINEERIVTLNRQYLPNFDLKKVEGHWSVEYINCLLSSSVKIDKEKILKLRIELSKHSTSSKNDNIENNNFEHFLPGVHLIPFIFTNQIGDIKLMNR